MVALCAPLLAMTVGLGIEASGWIVLQQGTLQRTADMAALAGALAYSSGTTSQTAVTQAAYVAEINGASGVTSPATRAWFPNQTPPTLTDNLVTIQVVNGVQSASDTAFLAKVQYQVPLLFSFLALKVPTITLSATAIAELVPSQTGKYCVLTLDTNQATSVSTAGISDSNGATVDLSQCGIQVNATGFDTLVLSSGATLNTQYLSTSGSFPCPLGSGGAYACGNGAYINVASGSALTNASAGINPYAGVATPTPSSTCSTTVPNNTYNSNTLPLSPQTFCGGLTISYGNLTMQSGIYIVEGGNFTLEGGATLTGTDVTIVLTGTGPNNTTNIGTAQIANGTTLNLTAPSDLTVPTHGIAIMQNPNGTTPPAASQLAGGTTVNIVGALDFPNSVVDFSNGSSNGASCTQLIAYQVVFTGGAKFSNNCGGTGTSGIGPSTTAALVE